MPQILERARKFGLALRHAERDLQDVGVGLKLVHCAYTVRIQGDYPQLDLALDLEISRQFGEGRRFPDTRRPKKSENGRTARTRNASQWPGATDFGKKALAESVEYPAPVDRIAVEVRYRLAQKNKDLLFVKTTDQKRVIKLGQRLVFLYLCQLILRGYKEREEAFYLLNIISQFSRCLPIG